ncbi:MAG: hypothetical protein Q8S13_06535 [Dehalococcoidia bacterium]|nr:hypothetical protein [Dehalococcoidia bacterium]
MAKVIPTPVSITTFLLDVDQVLPVKPILAAHASALVQAQHFAYAARPCRRYLLSTWFTTASSAKLPLATGVGPSAYTVAARSYVRASEYDGAPATSALVRVFVAVDLGTTTGRVRLVNSAGTSLGEMAFTNTTFEWKSFNAVVASEYDNELAIEIRVDASVGAGTVWLQGAAVEESDIPAANIP